MSRLHLITDQNWRDVPREQGLIERPASMPSGSPEAREHGATPISDDLDVLIPLDQMKERIEEANRKRQMPMHYLEEYGAEGAVTDGVLNWSALMFAAMERDVYEELDHGKGLDVNDPETFFEEEEEE